MVSFEKHHIVVNYSLDTKENFQYRLKINRLKSQVAGTRLCNTGIIIMISVRNLICFSFLCFKGRSLANGQANTFVCKSQDAKTLVQAWLGGWNVGTGATLIISLRNLISFSLMCFKTKGRSLADVPAKKWQDAKTLAQVGRPE